MPIYAYHCRECGDDFQTLVRAGETPACPSCESEKLEQRLSLIASPNKGGEADSGAPACGADMPGGCGACPAFAGAA
jgi:putative FmdB family regulatory protein